MHMKRGFISIVMTLVLALGPVTSVSAAVQTGEMLSGDYEVSGRYVETNVSAEYALEQDEPSDEEDAENGYGEENDPAEPAEEDPEKPAEEDPENPADPAEEEDPQDPTEEDPESPADPAEEEDPQDPAEEDPESPADPAEEEDPQDPAEEDPESPTDPAEEEDPQDPAEEDPESPTDPTEEDPQDPKAEEDPQSPAEQEEEDVDPDNDPEEDPEEVFTYTVKFDGNGATAGTMPDAELKEGETFTLSCRFTMTGYDCISWNTEADGSGTSYKEGSTVKDLVKRQDPDPNPDTKKKDKVSNDKTNIGSVTLYAQWNEHEFDVTYVLNGGTNNAANPNKFKITADTIILKEPVKKHSVFEGWFSDAQFRNRADKIVKGSTGNKIFYAKWREYTYDIVYDGHGATSGTVKPQEGLKYSAAYKLRTNRFKRKGYKFTSWNTKRSGSGKKLKDKAEVRSLTEKDGGKVTLYAQWKPEEYRIRYHLKGGKNSSKNPSKYTIKTKTITLKAPTRTGYTFLGWYKDKKYTKKITKIKKGSTGNIDVYAKWQVNRYTVQYYGNGATGGVVKPQKCRYGKEYTLRTNKFKRTGYIFKSWNRKKKGTGQKYKDKARISNLSKKDGTVIKLYAQWRPIKYKVKFYGNGATSGKMKTVSCTYDAGFELPKNKFKRDGYSFKGWNTEEDGSGENFDDEESVKNLTEENGDVVRLYARWEYDSDDDEATIWNYLSDQIGNDYGAAGVMGNLFAESGLRSNNLENYYNSLYGISDEEYTRQVDSGEYGNFANDHAGYGIAQWTFSTRKQALLDFARGMGTSISNLHTQLAFLWKELTETYSGLVDMLRTATSVKDASDKFMTIFERPADQSEAAKQRRAGYGWNFFNKFH